MQKSIQKKFFVLVIIAFVYDVLAYLSYEVNSCDR